MKIKIEFDANCADFLKISKKEQHPQKRVRLLAMAQLRSGKTMCETAENLGVGRVAIGKWYRRYKKHGLNGLDNAPRLGRAPKISRDREKEFVQKIGNLQDAKSGGRITGYDIQAMALSDFGADYADNSVYKVLKRLNVSWITARSKHPKSDKEAQDEFKKNFFRKLSKAYL